MALLILASCVTELPEETGVTELSSVIAGEVIFAGAAVSGPVAVLITNADNPPPPDGTGPPYDFTMVQQDAFTGSGAGIQGAPYAITGVPDGSWIVNALMDADGDFQPVLNATAGATCGDWVGTHLADLVTLDSAPVTVSDGQLMDDVSVLIAKEMTTERPAFVMGDLTLDQSAMGTTITATSTTIHSPVVTFAPPYDGSDPCGTAFSFYAEDADGDGEADPHWNTVLASAGVKAIWPRMYLRYMGEELEEGEVWGTELGVFATQLLDGSAVVGVPSYTTTMTGVYYGAALHILPNGTEAYAYPPDIPTGEWMMTLVSYTGQTWTVPNELADLGSVASGWDPSAQGAVIVME